MKYTTLINCEDAAAHRGDPAWQFIDCRFSLEDGDLGARLYQESHIPGAVYAHLDHDLSGPAVTGKTGRHPLPTPLRLVETFSRLGIGTSTQVIAYDDTNGQMAAARLWWLLRWAGHDSAAVLNGGFREWRRLGLPQRAGTEAARKTQFVGQFRDELIVNAGDVADNLKQGDYVILDSRSVDRFWGENERIDPVAGHIPGAVSAPFTENSSASGLMRSTEELHNRFETLAPGKDSDHVVFYCGSGVTAAQNVLAYAHARLGMPKLYAGSWSEWITDRNRPVAKKERL